MVFSLLFGTEHWDMKVEYQSEPYLLKMESRNSGMLGSCLDRSVTFILLIENVQEIIWYGHVFALFRWPKLILVWDVERLD